MRSSALGLAAVLATAACKESRSQEQGPPPAPAAPAPTAAAVDAAPIDLEVRARALAQRFLIVDGHIDVPFRLIGLRDGTISRMTEDVGERTAKGDFDFPRAREGGLDAPFMSIYVPVEYQGKGARALADQLIDLVESVVAAHPDRFAIARSPAEVAAIATAGKVALPMGIENGAAIEAELGNLRHFWSRGIRYVTLTHGKDNLIGDSSYDGRRTHGGLSAFGREVVAELNRLGIMVDVSHVSDQTFEQVMELSAAPAIASHSSLRHFVPGFERNMSDDMVRRLAARGGVIMINFGSAFLTPEARRRADQRKQAPAEIARREGLDPVKDAERIREIMNRELPSVRAALADVADHIDRAVGLAGIDHVGFGSDFDGVGDTLPTGLKDVSQYPNLIAELLRRGYSEADIEKLCGANVLRVWREVEAVSTRLRGGAPP